MDIIAAEKAMWEQPVEEKSAQLTDQQINQKYERGEGRIVVENNREKLPGFVEQLKSKSYMDLRPFYQRRPRWEKERQSRLIESFLINLPVPPVFLYEQDFNSFEVMDGQQRITALSDFYNNKLKLTGLQHWPELNGRYYHNLPTLVKAGIDRRSIASIVMLKESAPQDEEALLLRQIVFERLNTGGIQLERQEIRNALFQGPLNDMLIEQSRHDALRKAWGLPLFSPAELDNPPEELSQATFYQKMEDVELVLRFFALRNVDHYTRGMQGFLDLYMLRASKMPAEAVEELRQVFLSTISVAEKIFGELLFRPFDASTGEWKGRPQKAFFDAVMVGIYNNLERQIGLVENRERIIESTKLLFVSHEEGTFTGRGNSKADISNRINLFSQMLTEAA